MSPTCEQLQDQLKDANHLLDAAILRYQRVESQHDALRLAAGRALEALEKAIGLNYVPERDQDGEWHEALEALEKEHTALSAALAGDKGKDAENEKAL